MAKYTASKTTAPKSVETLKHVDDKRRNIPTAEFQAVLDAADQAPLAVAYARRNRDLDPQLV
jgi:adenine-specific DNA-methyltransferase